MPRGVTVTTTRSTIRKRLFAGATAATLLGSAAVVAIAPAAHAAECVGTTFTEDCELTVPVGMTELVFTATGASGGGAGNNSGGNGALVTATLPVTAGDVLQIRIGGPGGAAADGTGGPGGVNGGGAGANGDCSTRGGSGGGGGYTAVFGPDGTTPLVIAGGGSGANTSRLGVAAGQNADGTGTDGVRDPGTQTDVLGAGGGGGTLSAGGAGGEKANNATGSSGTAGSSLLGGDGGGSADSCAGSGGGGGYFGGGGGGASHDDWAAGTGGSGSSFVAGSATDSTITTASSSGGGSVSYSAPIEITSISPLPPGTVGSAYTPTTLTATGGIEPYTWSASDSVPPGLTLDPAGQVSGTPTTSGTFTFDVTVTDGTISDTEPFSITVAAGGGGGGDKQAQTAACVTPTKVNVKKKGTSRLIPAKCLTNADKPVGVVAKARMARGDITLHRLACKQGSRFTPTKTLPNGKGARYCSTGKLVVRTYGYRFNLRVNWFAPATSEFSAYKATRTFCLR